jgi:hypothetical protein
VSADGLGKGGVGGVQTRCNLVGYSGSGETSQSKRNFLHMNYFPSSLFLTPQFSLSNSTHVLHILVEVDSNQTSKAILVS